MSDDPKKTDAPTPDDAPTPRPILSDEDRIRSALELAQSRAPPALANALLQAKPIVVPLIMGMMTVFRFVAPAHLLLFQTMYTVLSTLPWDLLQAALGLGLCFFGGSYCASIAACEAFAMTGWPVTKRHLTEVYQNAFKIVKASESDDRKDDDGDGIADVKQIPAGELIERKVRLAARAVEDPQKLAAALGGLYTGWLAVQGVLRIEFARTINLAISCSQFVEVRTIELFTPFLAPFIGPDFVGWLPVTISSATRGFFVFFAWKLQQMVSAVQSAMRGGLMFSRGILNFANARGLKSLGGMSLEHDKTYLDELVGYAIATVGFYFQWHYGFAMPFPFSLVMLPLDAIEWYIRFSVSTAGGASDAPAMAPAKRSFFRF